MSKQKPNFRKILSWSEYIGDIEKDVKRKRENERRRLTKSLQFPKKKNNDNFSSSSSSSLSSSLDCEDD